MTRLRRCITNEWECHKPGALVELLQGWSPLLCAELLDNILDQLILPKLKREVETWNPRTATVPIHHWLHPWLPVAGERILQFTPMIKQKLSSVLSAWEPQDPSAHVVLAPWHGVFDDRMWDRLMLDHIVPPLVQGLRAARLDPTVPEGGGSGFEPFLWAKRWETQLPKGVYAALIEHELLYTWLVALRGWLCPNAYRATGDAPDL